VPNEAIARTRELGRHAHDRASVSLERRLLADARIVRCVEARVRLECGPRIQRSYQIRGQLQLELERVPEASRFGQRNDDLQPEPRRIVDRDIDGRRRAPEEHRRYGCRCVLERFGNRGHASIGGVLLPCQVP
jgi:hypothetical protein